MQDDAPESRSWTRLLWAIIALAVALRLYGLARYSIWYDESTTLYAMQFVNWDLDFLSSDKMRLIPLYPLLLVFWHGFATNFGGAGSESLDFILRLLPLFFGVLVVPLTFSAGRYLSGDARVGLLAAFMVAVSPFHIYYAQELRPHTLYVLLVLAAELYAFKALEENRPKAWVALVALSSLSFYAYYFSVWFMAAINLYVLIMIAVYKPVLKRWIVSQVALGITLVPAVLMALFTFNKYTQAEEQWFPHPTLVTVGITIKNYFAGYSPSPMVYWPMFLIVCAACLGGVAGLRTKPRAAIFLVTMSLAPLLIEVVFWSTQSFAFYTYRAQLAYSPVVFILAAAGFVQFRPRWLGVAAASALFALTVPTLADLYAQRIHPVWHHRIGARYKVDNRAAANYISERVHEEDYVVHSSTATLGPLSYHYLIFDNQSYIGFTDEEWQGQLKGIPDEEIWKSHGFFPRRIEEVSLPADRVWYVQSWWEPDALSPLCAEIRSWYDANALRLDRRHYDGLTLFLFDMDPVLREKTRTAWVADSGTMEVPLYAFPDTGLDDVAQAAWRASFAESFPPEPSRDGLGLDVWMDIGGQAELADLVQRSNDGYTAGIHVANRSDRKRRISVRAYRAEAVIRGLAFEREGGSDVWRPLHSHYGKVAPRARLTQSIPSGRIVRAVPLNAGRYGMFVQMYRDTGPRNEQRGVLRVNAIGAHGERVPVGERHGYAPGAEEGWAWVYLGEVESHGSPIELELIADNADNLPDAQVDIDRVMFVAVADIVGDKPAPFWTADVELGPHQETLVELRGTIPIAHEERVYIEFFDSENEVFRNLSFDMQP